MDYNVKGQRKEMDKVAKKKQLDRCEGGGNEYI